MNINKNFSTPKKIGKNLSEKAQKVMRVLLENYKGEEVPLHVNSDKWTLADLFIRQYLNNMVDGFGMINVDEMYPYVEHKEILIKENLISEKAWNNSGKSILW